MVFGPDVGSLFLTTFLIAAPAIAFCVKLYLKIKNGKASDEAHWYPVLIVGSVLTVLVITLESLSSEILQNLVCSPCIVSIIFPLC